MEDKVEHGRTGVEQFLKHMNVFLDYNDATLNGGKTMIKNFEEKLNKLIRNYRIENGILDDKLMKFFDNAEELLSKRRFVEYVDGIRELTIQIDKTLFTVNKIHEFVDYYKDYELLYQNLCSLEQLFREMENSLLSLYNDLITTRQNYLKYV